MYFMYVCNYVSVHNACHKNKIFDLYVYTYIKVLIK